MGHLAAESDTVKVPCVNVSCQVLAIIAPGEPMEEALAGDMRLDGASHGVVVEATEKFKAIFLTKGHGVARFYERVVQAIPQVRPHDCG